MLGVARLGAASKSPSILVEQCFFQAWIIVGCTPCRPANSLTVLSPLTAATATWALNAAVWDFRFRPMDTPFLDSPL